MINATLHPQPQSHGCAVCAHGCWNTQLEGARPRKSIPRPRLERAGGGGVGQQVTEIVVVAIGLENCMEKMQTL